MIRQSSRVIKKVVVFLIAFFLWGIYFLYYRTLRIRVLSPQAIPRDIPSAENRIYVFWHCKTFTILPLYRHLKIASLTLKDWKNLVFDQLCRFYGYQTIPVTRSRIAINQLTTTLNLGYPIGLAVDGPKGPVGVIKPGAFYLSKKTGKPIIAVRIQAERGFRVKHRWDQYEIPLPFSRVVIVGSDPIYAAETDFVACKKIIRQHLQDC